MEKMLEPSKVLQIAVYPKIYNILSFYSKGHYTIGISMGHQTTKNRQPIIKYAQPFIKESQNSRINQNRKPYILTTPIEGTNNKSQFMSQKFYVTYNQESIFLDTVVLFKTQVLESQLSNPQTLFFIDFKLYLKRKKTVKNPQFKASSQESSLKQYITITSIEQVDKSRIYISRNDLFDLDLYKRVLFSECEFFSFFDTYIASCNLGTKYRLHTYTIKQFTEAQNKQRIQYHEHCDKVRNFLLNDNEAKGQLIKKVSKLGVQQYRTKLCSESLSSYESIRRLINKLLKYEQQESFLKKIGLIQQLATTQIHLNANLSLSQIQKYYGFQDSNSLYYQIYKQINQLQNQTRYLWQQYIRQIQNLQLKTFTHLIHKGLIKQNNQKKTNMVLHLNAIKDDVRKNQHNVFLKRRKQVLSSMVVYQDDDIRHPFLMIEGYETDKSVQVKTLEITSLVVFVHGYQGSDYDLEKARNFLSLHSTNTYCLLIKSIQDEIDEHIQHLGEKVAQQIKTHMKMSMNSYKKINFVGYSLGGVIIRQTLKHLSQYKQKMNIFITFASPHLGVTQSDNYLVGTGIWYLINFQKVKNLKQLNCQTNSDSNEISMQTLSQCEGLSWFNKVILVSSKQDNFVPYYSSRIDPEICSDQKVKRMGQNLLSKIKKLERVQVWFDVQHDINTFDKILGRRAHIQFLQNRIFLDMFFRLYCSQL